VDIIMVGCPSPISVLDCESGVSWRGEGQAMVVRIVMVEAVELRGKKHVRACVRK